MMTLKKLSLALIISVFLSFTAATPNVSADVLKVGIYDFKPLVYLDEKASPSGLFIDIFNRIALDEGWKFQYVFASWNECLKRLERGELDLLVSIGISEERAKKLQMTNEFVLLDWGVVFTRDDHLPSSIFELHGKRVGVLSGSIYTTEFKNFMQKFNIEPQYVEMDEYTKVFSAVEKKEVDFGINTNLNGQELIKQYKLRKTGIVFSPIKLTYAASKTLSPKFIRKIDYWLKEFKANPRSIYYRAYDQYVTVKDSSSAAAPFWIFWALAGGGVGLLLLSLFIIALRYQVLERTKALTEANQHLHEQNRELNKLKLSVEQSERKFRRLIEGIQSDYFIYQHDTSGVFTYVSPSMENILGYTPEEFMTHFTQYLTDNPINEKCMEYTENSIKGSNQASYKVEIYHKDRSVHTLEVLECPIFSGDPPTVIAVEGIAHDISEQMRMEEEREKMSTMLIHAEKMASVGILAAGVAHEINNPLFVAKGFLEEMRAKIPSDVLNHEMVILLDSQNSALERISRIVQGLKTFSHVSASEIVDLNLKAVLDDTLIFCESLFRNDGIKIVVQWESGDVRIRGNLGKLQQVFINLLTNAKDAIIEKRQGKGGLITIRSRKSTYGVEMRFTDNGVGIPQNKLHQIFDPFYTSKAPGKGTGLGLSITSTILQSMHGKINVASQRNMGTTFLLELPLISNEEERSNHQQESVSELLLQQKIAIPNRVLIVEDEDDIRKLISIFFKSMGFEHDLAADGLIALEMCDHRSYDVIITDLKMPGMRGDELVFALEQRKSEAKIIIMSGGLFEDFSVESKKRLDALVAGYLVKPFTKDDLEKIFAA
ncbi:MAG: transporter substrate-binding domain-containing protein [Oligoflexia bacterium]|nr:transporter substrate-binding domain-containing protein [Oligoflexia bacterium]